MPEQQDNEISIEAAVAALPPYLKRAIAEVDPLVKSVSIAQKNKLYIDQQEGLGREVLLVMLGAVQLEQFLKNLTSEVGIPPELAETIADEVASEIFIPLRDAMRKYSEEPSAPEANTPNTPTTTPPQQVTAPAQIPNTVEQTLSQPQTNSLEKRAVGLAPKPDKKYTVDPYREPIE